MAEMETEILHVGDGGICVLCVPKRDQITPKGVRPQDAKQQQRQQRAAQKEQEQQQRKQQQQQARQRPGGPGQKKPRTRAVPVPPKVSRIAAVIAALFVVGVVAQYGATIAAVITTALTIAAITAMVVGAGWVAWGTREAVNWDYIPVWLARRREAKAALTERREQVRVEATQAIAIEPVADPAVQEWVERGMRNRRIDGYVPEPIRH